MSSEHFGQLAWQFKRIWLIWFEASGCDCLLMQAASLFDGFSFDLFPPFENGLTAPDAEEEGPYFKALVEGFGALDYVDEHTITLHHRFPNETPELFRRMAADLVALKIDVLVSVVEDLAESLCPRMAPSRSAKCQDFALNRPAFRCGKEVRGPCIQGGTLLLCPVMPLINPHHASPASAQMVQHRLGDFEAYAETL